MKKALSTLPKTLDETYDRILANIPKEYQEETIQLLQFLTYSERPLTIEEAVDAIAVDLQNDPQFNAEFRLPCPLEIARFGSSLVSLVERESHRELELAHFSVKEYLTTKVLPEPFQGQMYEATARGRMIKICLAYLSYLGAEESVDDIASQFPLARYSARYWMDHAKLAETSDGVQESIMDFFQNHKAYSAWRGLFDPERPRDKNPHRSSASPLYFASLKGLVVTVQTLLENGTKVNAQGGQYGNALQAASFTGYEKIVQILLEKGANVHAQGGAYGNALQAASLRGYEKIVQILLEKGADVHTQGGIYGNALQAASAKGHEKIVQILRKKGAN